LRWKTVSLRSGQIGVRSVDGSLQRFKSEGDPIRDQAVLYPIDKQGKVGTAPAGSLKFKLTERGDAIVNGSFGGHVFSAETQRQNPDDFPLMNRGFRWISEAPFFR
jgi:hypothetical protein